MATRSIDPSRHEAVARTLLLLLRYSTDISAIAVTTLGPGMAANKDIAVLLAVDSGEAATPGDLVRLTSMTGSDVSRSLGRLQGRGLVARRRADQDRRVVVVSTTPAARGCLLDFGDRLGDYFTAAAPAVKEILHLLHHPAEPAADPVTALEAAAGLAAAGRRSTAALTRAGRPYGVDSRRDRFALALLSDRGQLRPSQLATDLHLSRPSTTEYVDRLDRLGLVTRGGDPEGQDHRAVVITLTPRGRKAMQRLVSALDTEIDTLVPAMAATLGPFVAGS